MLIQINCDLSEEAAKKYEAAIPYPLKPTVIEIILMTQTDAEELLSFLEILLKFIYEFPGKIPLSNSSNSSLKSFRRLVLLANHPRM